MISVNNISASKVIEQRCLRDEDFGLSKAPILLSYLPTVYNDLAFDGTKVTVMRKYYINKDNNTLPIPNECLLLMAVGYEDDCGAIKGMWYNDELPIDILFANQKNCDCDNCNDGHSFCSNVKEFDKIEETVYINDEAYIKTTKTEILHDGRVLQQTTTPMLSDGSGEDEEVIYVEDETQICSLETMPCGCIAKTEANKIEIERLDNTCCSFNSNNGTRKHKCCTNKDAHTYTLDIQGRLIVLSPNYLKDYVIIKYITAVNSAGDYQIPSIALECVLAGLKYYYESNNQKAQSYLRGQNGMYHKMYTAEQNKLKRRLRPIPYERYMQVMGTIPYHHTKNNYYSYFDPYFRGTNIY